MRTPLLNMTFRFGGGASTTNEEVVTDKNLNDMDNNNMVSNTEDDVIFEGTPLASHMSDTGMEDWGIEQQLQQDQSSDQDDNNKSKFSSFFGKSSGVRRIITSKTAMPLMLSAEYASSRKASGAGTSALQRRRFKDIIRTALRPRLSAPENNQFLERFKYVYVGSHLLDKTPRLHLSTGPSTFDTKMKATRHKEILFGARGPWDIRMGPKYWAGAGGGYVVLVVVLLSWRAKTTPTHATSPASTVTATTTLVVMLTLGLYLYAHNRRRMLRMLRAKALAFASKLVHDNEHLDRSLGRAVALIREVELITLGFCTDEPGLMSSIPAARLDTSVAPSDRAAKHLRGAVCAVLYLAQSEYSTAIEQCAEKCTYLDLQQYFNIYGLTGSLPEAEFSVSLDEHMNDNSRITISGTTVLAREEYYGDLGCTASLAKIRKEFRRMHFMRKVFVCCLLSMSTTGECNSWELDRWATVVDHLESLCGLLTRLTGSISRDQLFRVETDEDIPDDAATAVDSRRFVRQTSEISDAMQRVYAQLSTLNDERADETNYEMLGNDIKNLLDVWERGKARNRRPLNREEEPETITNTSNPEQDEQSSGRSPFRRTHMPSLSTSTTTSTLVEFDDDSCPGRKPIILEGIAEDDDECGPKNNMSRQARIELMKQRRLAQSDAKKTARDQHAQQQQFVIELGSVLKRRSYVH